LEVAEVAAQVLESEVPAVELVDTELQLDIQ